MTKNNDSDMNRIVIEKKRWPIRVLIPTILYDTYRIGTYRIVDIGIGFWHQYRGLSIMLGKKRTQNNNL